VKRGIGWPIGVTVILGLTISANIWLIRVASADPSFAVEERYYQRALDWDHELAQRATNARLGWNLEARVSAIEPGSGASLGADLRDATGAPIADATVAARVVHVGRAGQPVDVVLKRDSSGAYRAHVPLERPGLWELRFEVQRGTDRFTAIERVDTSLTRE
jgi:nitrogen fixation protein FixH